MSADRHPQACGVVAVSDTTSPPRKRRWSVFSWRPRAPSDERQSFDPHLGVRSADLSFPTPSIALQRSIDNRSLLSLVHFRVKRRGDVEPRNACPLEVRVEKAAHAVRRNGKLATS